MFKTRAEKHAYKAGIKKGRKGGTVWRRKRKRVKRKTNTLKPGAYNMYGRINENLVDDRHGPVVFWGGDDFERTSTGRIKGSYTSDGFFEPD